MYTVYHNDFHGGHEIARHKSIKAALKTVLKHQCIECQCLGPHIEDADGADADNIITAYNYHRYTGKTKAEAIDAAAIDYRDF